MRLCEPEKSARVLVIFLVLLLCHRIQSQRGDEESCDKVDTECGETVSTGHCETINTEMQYSEAGHSVEKRKGDLNSAVNHDDDVQNGATGKSHYSNRDFMTDSSGQETSDDDRGASKEPEPKARKYKQTTLSFGKTSDESGKKKDKHTPSKWSLKKRWSDKDTEQYRNGYPGKKDDPNLNDNLRFYRGDIPSTPDGDYIDEIHKNWWGNYRLLERHHGYIQWIFPIREDGMNWQAQALQLHEAKVIREDKILKKRVIKSYKMMLDFYGMEIADYKTGDLQRSDNWKDRYENLNRSSHNYLRITRILKSLGEMGLEHLKKPFLQFVLMEALEEGTLKRTLNSCRDYWIGTVKDDEDREELYRYVENNS